MTSPNKNLKYLSIEALLQLIESPHREICERILADNRALFETARGSTFNHQTWDGGYIDHITDCLNIAYQLYGHLCRFGRTVPFSVSDALLVLFIHDLEKPWKIQVNTDGSVSLRDGLQTKEDFARFRDEKLAEYGLSLNAVQANAFKYVEGEYKDYSSKHRVMNELAAFCHMVDTWSARGWYDYPKVDDEWPGATRFRTA
ncbi:MAG: hypothetical protein ACJKSS_00190 [Patescibacteria group bacterium UBA2103]